MTDVSQVEQPVEAPKLTQPVTIDESIADCTKEINALLSKYNCELDVEITLKVGALPVGTVKVIAKK